MRGWILRLWCLATTALAQNNSGYQYDLMTTLSQYPQLTAFTSVLNQYAQVWNQTASGNFTILAPSNDAISNYLRSSGLPLNDTSAIFEAWTTYHILQGPHSKNGLQSTTQFIPTLLTDPDYNNVTGGQRVEVQSAGEQVYFLSGNKSRSDIVQGDIIYFGTATGFIHIIDTLLIIPTNLDVTITNAHLSGVAQVSADIPSDPKLVEVIASNPADWTLFGPNTSNSIDVATLSAEDLYELQAYHIILGPPLYSTDFTDGLQLQTLEGEDVTITVINGTIYVNAAEIIIPDYLMINGVLHVLNTALDPNDTSARPPTLNTTSAVPSSTSTKSSLSTGAKAGIGIGAALGGLFLLALAVFLFRRHSHNRNLQPTAIPQLDPRENGGMYEVDSKVLQPRPTELSGEQVFRELDSTTERWPMVHELD